VLPRDALAHKRRFIKRLLLQAVTHAWAHGPVPLHCALARVLSLVSTERDFLVILPARANGFSAGMTHLAFRYDERPAGIASGRAAARSLRRQTICPGWMFRPPAGCHPAGLFAASRGRRPRLLDARITSAWRLVILRGIDTSCYEYVRRNAKPWRYAEVRVTCASFISSRKIRPLIRYLLEIRQRS